MTRYFLFLVTISSNNSEVTVDTNAAVSRMIVNDIQTRMMRQLDKS